MAKFFWPVDDWINGVPQYSELILNMTSLPVAYVFYALCTTRFSHAFATFLQHPELHTCALSLKVIWPFL